MVDFYRTNARVVSRDEGLRQYMLYIYNYMAMALAFSGLIAYASATSGITRAIFGTPIGLIVMFAPIGVVLYFGAKLSTISLDRAKFLLFLYAGLIGLSLSTIFLVFRVDNIARAFFITAGMFAGVSIYGHTTKKNLDNMGSFLIMGVWGILIASIINIFLKSSGLYFAISLISVGVFTALVAYDTQKMKTIYYNLSGSGDSEMAGKVAIFGALNLYIDFIAIFVNLLQLMQFFGGNRR